MIAVAGSQSTHFFLGRGRGEAATHFAPPEYSALEMPQCIVTETCLPAFELLVVVIIMAFLAIGHLEGSEHQQEVQRRVTREWFTGHGRVSRYAFTPRMTGVAREH